MRRCTRRAERHGGGLRRRTQCQAQSLALVVVLTRTVPLFNAGAGTAFVSGAGCPWSVWHPPIGLVSAAVPLRPPPIANAHLIPVQHEASSCKGALCGSDTCQAFAAGALVRARDRAAAGAGAGAGAVPGRRTAPRAQHEPRRRSMDVHDVCRLVGNAAAEHDPWTPAAAGACAGEKPGENRDGVFVQHLVQTLPLGEPILVSPAGVHKLEPALPQAQPELPGLVRALRHHVLPGNGVPGLPRPLEGRHGAPRLRLHLPDEAQARLLEEERQHDGRRVRLLQPRQVRPS